MWYHQSPAIPPQQEYSNTVNTQENDLNNNFMKMIVVLKEESKNSLKEIEEKTTKKIRGNQQTP